MSYVYRRSEPELWTVGFYTPLGAWESESDHSTRDGAAARVHYLNGGAALAWPLTRPDGGSHPTERRGS